MPLLPVFKISLVHIADGQTQGPESFAGEFLGEMTKWMNITYSIPEWKTKDYIQMLLSLVLDVVIAGLQVVVDNRVGSFAIKTDPAVGSAQDDRHPFTDVIEIQDAQQFVDFRLAHHLEIGLRFKLDRFNSSVQPKSNLDSDGIGRPGFKDESEITGSRNQRSFIRRLSLIFQFA